jgi:muramidase (phage lysozyme)
MMTIDDFSDGPHEATPIPITKRAECSEAAGTPD